MSQSDLERRLGGLGASIEWPAEPELAARVRRRIEARPHAEMSGAKWPNLFRRPALVMAAAAVLLVTVALLASPAARTAVADFLGIGGIRISGGDERAPIAGDLRLGARVALARAEDLAGFDVTVPATLGDPDEVYFDRVTAGGQVSLVYEAGGGLPAAPETRVGILITQFRAELNAELYRKIVQFEGAEEVRAVEVGGAEGYWIEGPHTLEYVGPGGVPGEARSRLAANTLIWSEGGTTFRLESALARDDALRIAESHPRGR